MKKTLVIAEKYLAAQPMAKVLNCTEEKEGYLEGDDYIITWADGHLIGYKYPEEYNEDYKEWKLEDLPLKFEPDKCLKVLPEKEKQFEVIKKLIQGEETDKIINAGDAGREGYLIQYWIYKLAENKKPVKVLWASSLTEDALRKAFANLHDDSEFEDIRKEAEARAEMDYILGMNYSRLLTLKCSNDITLPYGRCMTTLLNLIVERENEISEFEPSRTYSIEAEFKEGFKAVLVDPENKEIVFEYASDANGIIKELEQGELSASVYELTVKEKSERVANLYSLPELQAAIGKKYKYSPAETLQIVQKLYERQILTYPRTDSNYLTEDMETTIYDNLSCCSFGKFKTALNRCVNEEVKANKKCFNDENVTDHHALIPDVNYNMEKIYGKLTEEEKNVFDEIVYRFLGIFSKERVTRSVSAIFLLNGYLFRCTESIELEPGYKLLRNVKTEKEVMIPFFQFKEAEEMQGKAAEITEIKIKERVSEPPSRYTVGSIIELMQKYNIGTSATRAATIEKLLDKKRPFLVLKNGKYYSSPLGRMYVAVVPEELRNAELTNDMEWKLQQVKEGALEKEDVLNEIYEEFHENMKNQDFKRMTFSRVEKVRKSSRDNYKKRRRFKYE